MNKVILILTIIAVGLIGFNVTKLNFDQLLEGDSFTALVTIIIGLCAIILLQILRVSRKIDDLNSSKR